MKKLITIMLSFVLALCFSVSAFASEMTHIGYYAILKDKFSPTDPLITNHLVKYVGQNPEYYRFYEVYSAHEHEADEYQRYPDYISLSINVRSIAKPVKIVNGYWQDVKSDDLNNGLICTTNIIKLSGTFVAKPYIILVADSATRKNSLYEKTDCTGSESLNVNTALIDILNITGPHPGWNRQIAGSKGLPY